MTHLEPSRWITTVEASELTGFSRPFIERLLAGGRYEGKIRNASNNKRLEVKADEFQEWARKISAGTEPGDLAQTRAEAILDAEATPTGTSNPELRAESRARALALAKTWGTR